MATIELSDVSKSYVEPGGGAPVEVLKAVTFSLDAGESAAVVGPSGCGKSTLLNIIGALDRADSGKVEVAGNDLGDLSDKDLARFRGESVGFIFQAHHLLPQLTLLENVLLPTLALKAAERPARAESEERAHHLIGEVGLDDRTTHRPAQLSGGERQRAAVVRSLINSPDVILADEPTGALDEKNAHALADLLGGLVKGHDLTLVTVTHDPEIASRMGATLELADGVMAKR